MQFCNEFPRFITFFNRPIFTDRLKEMSATKPDQNLPLFNPTRPAQPAKDLEWLKLYRAIDLGG